MQSLEKNVIPMEGPKPFDYLTTDLMPVVNSAFRVD